MECVCKSGVAFAVRSGDPGVLDTTLAGEIARVVEAAGLGPDEFEQMTERSWRYRSEALSGRAAHGSGGPSPQMERQAAARCKG